MDTDLFFPGRGGYHHEHAAKTVCAGCPVRDECLTDALEWEVPSRRFGIRGGFTPAERERLGSPLAGRRRQSLARCGTDAGYYRHLRTLGEPACGACKEAHAAYTRLRKASA
jgi:hypothetical protein